MGFWRTIPGVVVMLLLLAVVAGVTWTGVAVYRVIHPTRRAAGAMEVATMLAHVEDVEFSASDGVRLAGWFLPGQAGMSPVILCHDLGETRTSLVSLAIPLQKAGFPVLLFDFRGHGDSAPAASGLGLAESRDVLGAVDYLASRKGLRSDRIGAFGSGMGAYAVVLAAADRPSVRVLVLDRLYRDAGEALSRRVFGTWRTGSRYLGFLPRAMFAVADRSLPGRHRAADILPRLLGAEMLLVAPADDPALAAEMKRMYEAIPLEKGVEGNLVTLPATWSARLYGADLDAYVQRILPFFQSRLPRR